MLGLIGEAKDLLKGIVPKKTKTYDPSKNKVIISEGLELDGMLSAELSEDTKTSTVKGVDAQYYAIVEDFNEITLSVTLLTTSRCYSALQTLDVMSKQEKAVLPITVIENGEVIDSFVGSILSLGGRTLDKEGSAKTVVFSVKTRRAITGNEKTKITTETAPTGYDGNATSFPYNQGADDIVRRPLLNVNQIGNE